MMRLRTAFLWSMVVSLGLDAVLGIVVLLIPSYGPEEELLASAALFAAYSLVALLCAIVLEKRRLVPLMWTGIVCGAVALCLWMVLTWFGWDELDWKASETVARLGGTFTTPAILIAQCGLISLPLLESSWAHGVRLATIAASAFLGGYILLLVWSGEELERMIGWEFMARALGVLCILVACGTVVTPILWKVQAVRRLDRSESIPARVQVRLVCPRCGADQLLRAGPAHCATCGLRIEVRVEEPRCTCGYLLHTLKGDRCPECGREIPVADRWAAAGTPQQLTSGD